MDGAVSGVHSYSIAIIACVAARILPTISPLTTLSYAYSVGFVAIKIVAMTIPMLIGLICMRERYRAQVSGRIVVYRIFSKRSGSVSQQFD